MAVHLDSLLNSVTRSREPSHANSSLPRCETFGLSATVISTAFPRLALSPRTEGKTMVPCLAVGGRVCTHFTELLTEKKILIGN